LPYVYSPIAGRCILPVPIPPSLPPPSCPAPWLYSEQAGGCICPSGYVVQGGQCVPGTARSCAAPFVYSAEQNRCVCGPGLRPYGAGCAPVNPKPSPQENIVWVQSCLEVAGYDPGPIDGLPGPQTRSAWNQFRADEGFSSEEVPFTD